MKPVKTVQQSSALHTVTDGAFFSTFLDPLLKFHFKTIPFMTSLNARIDVYKRCKNQIYNSCFSIEFT